MDGMGWPLSRSTDQDTCRIVQFNGYDVTFRFNDSVYRKTSYNIEPVQYGFMFDRVNTYLICFHDGDEKWRFEIKEKEDDSKNRAQNLTGNRKSFKWFPLREYFQQSFAYPSVKLRLSFDCPGLGKWAKKHSTTALIDFITAGKISCTEVRANYMRYIPIAPFCAWLNRRSGSARGDHPGKEVILLGTLSVSCTCFW